MFIIFSLLSSKKLIKQSTFFNNSC